MPIKKYSRQQAIRLSGSTSSRLSYLDRVGLVCPEKIGEGEGSKPAVLYTEKQIEEIKLIDKASEFLHLEGIRLAVKKKCLPKVVDVVSGLLA